MPLLRTLANCIEFSETRHSICRENIDIFRTPGNIELPETLCSTCIQNIHFRSSEMKMEIHFVSWRTVSLEISKPYRPIPCRTIIHLGLPDTPKTRNILKSIGK